jgi:hypothetical protein
MNAKRAGFVVEHDFIMATYLADKYFLIFFINVGLLFLKESQEKIVSRMLQKIWCLA